MLAPDAAGTDAADGGIRDATGDEAFVEEAVEARAVSQVRRDAGRHGGRHGGGGDLGTVDEETDGGTRGDRADDVVPDRPRVEGVGRFGLLAGPAAVVDLEHEAARGLAAELEGAGVALPVVEEEAVVVNRATLHPAAGRDGRDEGGKGIGGVASVVDDGHGARAFHAVGGGGRVGGIDVGKVTARHPLEVFPIARGFIEHPGGLHGRNPARSLVE